MKIVQLLSGFNITLNNKERQFVEKYNQVKIDNLNEQEQWLAQNLVRRGIYKISKDNKSLIKNLHERN